MKSRLAVVVLLTGILVVLPSASGHVTGPDDCNAAAEPPMVGGNLDSVMASLRWESDAADLGNGIVCFDRYVRNRSQDRKLIFEWPPGNMAAPYGIPPGKEMHYNARLLSSESILEGPLFYGSTGNPPIGTQVYREKTGKTQARTLKSHVQFWVFDEEGGIVRSELVFTSAIVLAGGKQSIRYVASNKSAIPTAFLWTSPESPEFNRQVAIKKMSNPLYRFEPIENAVNLPPGSDLTITVGYRRPTQVKLASIRIYSRAGREIARTPGPALTSSEER